jgi:hypothetical protein
MVKHIRRFVSLILFVVGCVLCLYSFSGHITGGIIGVDATFAPWSLLLGVLLIVISVVTFATQKGLEGKLETEKDIILQTRKGESFIYDVRSGNGYTLNEIKELSKDPELKNELRKEYFSDLLRGYSNSEDDRHEEYQKFIFALSPNSKPHQLEKRLKQFRNAYSRMKDKIEYMNPDRIVSAKDSDFEEKEYVRFEDEKITLWPEEGQVGFLPFDEIKVNPARGPLFSVIPLNQLIRDGYLLADGKSLNPKWSAQKRQDYVRDSYGIDRGSRNRTMIFFKIEEGSQIEPYGHYENIAVTGKVPLVKVLKKK